MRFEEGIRHNNAIRNRAKPAVGTLATKNVIPREIGFLIRIPRQIPPHVGFNNVQAGRHRRCRFILDGDCDRFGSDTQDRISRHTADRRYLIGQNFAGLILIIVESSLGNRLRLGRPIGTRDDIRVSQFRMFLRPLPFQPDATLIDHCLKPRYFAGNLYRFYCCDI